MGGCPTTTSSQSSLAARPVTPRPAASAGADRVPHVLPGGARESYGVAKYGERFPFSGRCGRSDEFQVLQDLPGEMSRYAIQTEDVLTTQVLAGEDG